MLEDFIFRAKPIEIKAFNVGVREDVDNVPDWLLDACSRGNAARKVSNDPGVRYQIKTLCGMGIWKEAHVGDWITCDANGALDVLDNLTIQNNYEFVRKTTAKEALLERERKIHEAAENKKAVSSN